MSTRLRKYADVINIRLVVSERIPSTTISNPNAAAALVRSFYESSPVELFGAIYLNSANGVIAFSVVSSGILNSSLVHPREVFNRALLANAAGVILIHNHPSGNPEPSGEDVRITKQLAEAGRVLGIPVHDHVIITPDGKYTSLAERGLV